MKVLVIGGDGMLGHELLCGLTSHEVRVTLRKDVSRYSGIGLFGPHNAYGGVDVREVDTVSRAITDFRPAAIINAAGIVKQRPEAADPVTALEVNSLFPHRLADCAAAAGSRLIHISTDCVFSGDRGRYTERDRPDPIDLYGRTKLLGEPGAEGTLTLRTSMVGLELGQRRGLVEWALRQHDQIAGYRYAVFSGLTTTELARVLDLVLTKAEDLRGIWHVASAPISKLEFLSELMRRLGRQAAHVVPDESVHCDRSLVGAAFEAATGYTPPPWDAMLDELVVSIERRAR